MNNADTQRYQEWLRANGVNATPTHDRRAGLRLRLHGLQNSIQRATDNAKHAGTRLARQGAEAKLERLLDEEMQLEQELTAEPIGECRRCGSEILDPSENDYGVCRECRNPPPPDQRRSLT